MDRGAWQAKSCTQLSDFHFQPRYSILFMTQDFIESLNRRVFLETTCVHAKSLQFSSVQLLSHVRLSRTL